MISQVKIHICSKLQDGEVKGILRQKGKMQRKAALIYNSDPSPKDTSCLLSSCSHHSNVPQLVRVPQMETGRAYMRIQILEGCGFFCFVLCSNPNTQNSYRHMGGPWVNVGLNNPGTGVRMPSSKVLATHAYVT